LLIEQTTLRVLTFLTNMINIFLLKTLMLGYCGGGSFIHGVTERVLEIVLRRLGEGDTRLRRSNKSNEHIVVDRLDGWGLLRSITLSVGIIIGARSYGIISSNSTQFILKIAVDFASSTEA